MIAYRNLFKKAYLIHGSEKIPLSIMETAWRVGCGKEEEADDDIKGEVQCVISNLISQGKMKGYISYEHNFLVLSKANPFPTTSIIKPLS